MNMPTNRTTLSFLQTVVCLVLLALPASVRAFDWRPQVDVGGAPLNMGGCEQSQSWYLDGSIIGEPGPERLVTEGHICRGVLPTDDDFPIELRVGPNDPDRRTFGYRELPEQYALEYVVPGFVVDTRFDAGPTFSVSFSQGIRAVDVVNAWILLPRLPAGYRLEIEGDVTLYSAPGAELRFGLDGATGDWLVDEIPESAEGDWLVPEAAVALRITRPLSDLAIRLVAVDERAASPNSFRVAFVAPPEDFVPRTVALPRVWFFPQEPVAITEAEPTAISFSEPISGLTDADLQLDQRRVVAGTLNGDGVNFSYTMTARAYTWLSLGILQLPGGIVRSANLGLPNAASSTYFFWQSGVPELTISDFFAPELSTRSVSVAMTPPADVWVSQDDGPFRPALPGFNHRGGVSMVTRPAPDGEHTLRFRLRDQQGRIYEPAAPYVFNVYATPPVVRITSPVPALDDNTPTFTFESNTPVESYECTIGLTVWRPCTSPFTITNSLADGPHTLTVRAYSSYNFSGEWTAEQSFFINAAPPSIFVSPFIAPVTSRQTLELTLISNEEVVEYRCRVGSSGAPAPCESPFAYTSSAPGPQTLYVEATDTTGSVGTATFSWVWDATPPETTITAAPQPMVSSETALFRFTGSESDSTFLCSLDGAEFTTCSSPRTYTALAPGVHTFAVIAADRAGNRDPTPATHSWEVTASPDTVIALAPPQSYFDTTARVEFTSTTPGASFECQLNSTSWSPCTSPMVYTRQTPGFYAFSVRAVTIEGVRDSTPASTTWSNSSLQTTLTSSPGRTNPAGDIDFQFTTNAVNSTFECRLTRGFTVGTWTTCESPLRYTGLPSGAHSFDVRYRTSDGSVDTTPATRDFQARPPVLTLTRVPTNPSRSSSATFEFTSSTPGSTFRCAVNGRWRDCSSPFTVTGLTADDHRFEVSARVSSQLDSGVVRYEWNVNLNGPDTQITEWPDFLNNLSRVSFELFSPDSFAAGYQCRVDDGPWAACDTPFTFDVMLDGLHTLDAAAVDEAGNRDISPVRVSWIRETVAPETTLIDSPPVRSTSRSGEFVVTSNEPGDFMCRIFPSEYESCDGRTTISVPSHGSYLFQAYAVDRYGNEDPTPISHVWVVEPPPVPPTLTLTSTPPALSNLDTVLFAFTGVEEGMTVRCLLDDVALPSCVSPVEIVDVAHGEHEFRIEATNALGVFNAEAAVFVFETDLIAPETTLVGTPDLLEDTTDAEFEFIADDSATVFLCAVDGEDFVSCDSPYLISDLADGEHTFEVMAVDGVGNIEPEPATFSWTVDTLAPETTITSTPDSRVASLSATFTLASNEPGTFMCRVVPAAFAACDASHEVTVPGDGEYTFEAYAIDEYGNADPTPASFTWTVDTAPPTLTLTSTPPALSNLDAVVFAFIGVEDGMTVRCLLDDVELPSCVSPVEITDVTDGEHEFRIEATNALGVFNAEAAVFGFETDLVAPETTLVTTPELLEDVADAEFEFIADDAGAAFLCAFDGEDFISCDSPYLISELADGEHTFEVMAVDGVGNIEPEPSTFSWTVDRLAPETTITDGPEELVSVASATLVFESSEPGTFVCSLDGEEPFACESPLELEGLADGEHSVTIAAVDILGIADETPAVWTWRVDTQAPDTLFESAPMSPSDASQGEFTISATEENSSFECSLDGGGFGPCSAVVVTSALADGAHFFEARAIDEAGNMDASPARHDWLIDTRPPDTDGDGVSDRDEGVRGTNPLLADTDEDGLCDGAIAVVGVCDEGEDTNGDGVVDDDESNPLLEDTDGDGLLDGVEVLAEVPTDALNADTDGDGYCDGPVAVEDVCEAGEDLNADGMVDDGETDPNNADDYPGAGDGDVDDADAGDADAGEGDVGEGDVEDADAGDADAGEGDVEDADAGDADAGQGDVEDADAGEGDVSDAGDADAGQGDVEDVAITDTVTSEDAPGADTGSDSDSAALPDSAVETDTSTEDTTTSDATTDATPQTDAGADGTDEGDATNEGDAGGEGASSGGGGGGGGGCTAAGSSGTAPVWTLALLLALTGARPRWRRPGVRG